MKRRVYGLIGIALVVLTGLVLLLMRTHTAKQQQTAVSPQVPYAALGDSVAAGIGLQPYSDPSACDRTDQSYPHQVAAGLHYHLYNLACSGATMPSGILGTQNVNNAVVPAQLDQLYKLPKPHAITITDGANDISWTNFLANCYRGVCGTPADSAAFASLLSTYSANLHDMLGSIQDHYGSSVPPVIVTGYYQVVPEQAASCQDLSGMDANEQAWIREEQTALNDAIRTTVSGFVFAHYTAVDFSGHELCSSTPWVQALTDAAPYHPAAAGQTAIAQKVMAAIITATGGKQ